MKKILSTLICLQSVFTFGQAVTLDTTFLNTGSGLWQHIQDPQTRKMVVLDDGKILLGGNFGAYNGSTAKRYFTRINADGSIDPAFTPGGGFLNHTILDIAIQSDGKIVVVGSFYAFSAPYIIRNRVARFNSDGSLDTSFDPGSGPEKVVQGSTISGTLECCAIQPDGKILLAGSFTTFNGVNRRYIVRLNEDASIDYSFNANIGVTSHDYGIRTMVLQPDGKILIAGNFTTTSGYLTNFISRLNTDGSIDVSFSMGTGFDGVAGSRVSKLALQADGKVLATGEFNSYRGVARKNIVRINSNGTLDTTFDPGTGLTGGTGSTVVVKPDGKILIGGSFDLYNGVSRKGIVQVNTDGVIDTSFDAGSDNSIYAITIQPNGRILIGGGFTSINGVSRGRIARLLNDCSVSHFISETACGSFTWTDGDGETYTSSTSVSHTFVGGASNGCDSIVTLNLTINQPTSSSVTVSECEEYTWAVNNQTYTSSGSYTHVIPNANNCDSTITLNLTINQPTSSSVSVSECDSYTWSENNQTYTSSGSYTHVIPNVNNCDSTITLNLTINNVDNTVSVSGITLTANQAGASYQWVDCDNGNAPISGETAQSFDPTANGSYAVEVTANGCTETSNCVAVNSVGIESLEQNGWSVYPNPGNGLFTIKGNNLSNSVISVTNTLGQTIFVKPVITNEAIIIDLTNEPTGIYLLMIDNKIEKLIKQ